MCYRELCIQTKISHGTRVWVNTMGRWLGVNNSCQFGIIHLIHLILLLVKCPKLAVVELLTAAGLLR